MDAREMGTLTTRLLRFSGGRVFVNAAAEAVTAEVVDEEGKVVRGLSNAACVGVSGDKTLQEIKWREASLESVAGKVVRLRFNVRRGSLFAFWVSWVGKSGGYTAAGGPGLREQDV
jgi:hypothetical protein